MKCDRRTYGILIAVCVTAGVIFGNSLLNSETSNGISKIIAETIQAVLDPNGQLDAVQFHVFIRKAAHFTEFVALGVSLFFLIRHKLAKHSECCRILTVLLLAFGIAGADELIQRFTGRTSLMKDVMIDFSGAVTGMTLMLMWEYRRKKKL